MKPQVVEELGKDHEGHPSSLSVIKTGKNRGLRHRETKGKWICVSGYDCDARQEAKAPHHAWAKAMLRFGLRVGILLHDGCKDFYVFQEGK
jgi:hypothetical protein